MTATPDTMTKTATTVRVTAQTLIFSSADSLQGRTRRPLRLYRFGAKRILDTLIILVSAPIVIPVVLALALLIKMQGGKAFYSQERIGLGGRVYTMWKLRSMTGNADETLEAHLEADPAARAEWDRTQKLKNDPRITKLGRILRKSSLDELPQLFNVLKGDMALVGPRPMMPEQQTMYPGTAYYNLRPGITGMWQVSKRNESSFANRARFDAQYDRRLALITDIKLLLATIRVVIRGTGH